MGRAILVRNDHEREQHQYIHVPLLATSWSFAQKFSRKGRSTITEKKQ